MTGGVHGVQIHEGLLQSLLYLADLRTIQGTRIVARFPSIEIKTHLAPSARDLIHFTFNSQLLVGGLADVTDLVRELVEIGLDQGLQLEGVALHRKLLASHLHDL